MSAAAGAAATASVAPTIIVTSVATASARTADRPARPSRGLFTDVEFAAAGPLTCLPAAPTYARCAVLPTFVVIGAKKSGTTSLHRYLDGHPQVWLPKDKRLEFFTDVNWHRGTPWYESQFAAAGAAPARGEITTSYARYPLVGDVAARMHAVVPHVRLVYVVREPLRRIESHYRYARTEGWETRPIDDAVLGNLAEFVAPSQYAFQLGHYLEHFDRSQLLVVVSEDLRDDRAATMATIFDFLGVDAGVVPDELKRTYHRGEDLRRPPSAVRRLRSSRAYRAVRPRLPSGLRDRAWRAATQEVSYSPEELTLAPSTREELLQHLRPDLVRLRDIMGGSFHCWGHLDGR